MGESSDPRYDFLQDFTLKSLRLKPDKWVRMMVSDEQRNFITNFVERERPQVGRENDPRLKQDFTYFYLRRTHAGQWMVKCQSVGQKWFIFFEYFVKSSR